MHKIFLEYIESFSGNPQEENTQSHTPEICLYTHNTDTSKCRDY